MFSAVRIRSSQRALRRAEPHEEHFQESHSSVFDERCQRDGNKSCGSSIGRIIACRSGVRHGAPCATQIKCQTTVKDRVMPRAPCRFSAGGRSNVPQRNIA